MILNIEEIRKMRITASDIKDLVKDEICEHYCKYPDNWDEEKEGVDLYSSKVCANCPLGLLG